MTQQQELGLVYETLRRLWTRTYNAAYAEAVRTIPTPETTSEALVECHAIARKITSEVVHTERMKRVNGYLANGYGWCMSGCGRLTSPNYAYCPSCADAR